MDRDPERELWSTFGYETVCLLWGLPLNAVQTLPDTARQQLARVSIHIDGLPQDEHESLINAIKRAKPAARLARFQRIARTLPPVRPTRRMTSQDREASRSRSVRAKKH